MLLIPPNLKETMKIEIPHPKSVKGRESIKTMKVKLNN